MKKILCFVLCAAILVSGATLFASSAEKSDELNFAVASDLHYNSPRDEETATKEKISDDPVFWYANRRAAMEDESGFIIDEFLNECASNNDVDYVLISGDLVDDGKTIIEDHRTVAAKLKAFEEKTGKSVYVVNGNHDASENDGETSFDQFREIYADFGYNEALDTCGKLSYTANLGDKYRLIALDSCSETESTEDGMTIEKLNWVTDMAKKAYDEGRYPILMMHHNLLDHMPLQRIFSRDFIVRNHHLTAELFADAGIKLVFTGHEHCGDGTSYTSALGNVIYDFATTSLTMYPLAYRTVKINDNEIDYKNNVITHIDTAALKEACPWMNDEIISSIEADANAHSKAFLKAGVQYRLELSLSKEKIGIAEDSIIFPLVNTAVTGLVDLLRMPIYGENSAEEIAKGFNIELPKTNYKCGWDLATDLVAYHYSGNEPYTLESDEVVLLLRMVDLILLEDLSTVNDKVFIGAINELLGQDEGLFKAFTKACTGIFGPVTAGEYFLLAVASPIIEDFAGEDDVDDNNGTIPGYGADSDNFGNISANLSGIAARIAHIFSNFFKIILKIFKVNL